MGGLLETGKHIVNEGKVQELQLEKSACVSVSSCSQPVMKMFARLWSSSLVRLVVPSHARY